MSSTKLIHQRTLPHTKYFVPLFDQNRKIVKIKFLKKLKSVYKGRIKVNFAEE